MKDYTTDSHFLYISPQNVVFELGSERVNPFTPIRSKRRFSQLFQEKCTGKVVRVNSVIIFHLSKL